SRPTADDLGERGGGVDKFRLKVKNVAGAVVYDNVPGASDDIDTANPQLIDNGNIQVHSHALGASGGTVMGSTAGAPALTPEALQPFVTQAITPRAAAGATPEQVQALRRVEVRIAGLPGDTLGMAETGILWISPDAAGHGWFIDLTPWDDVEFAGRADSPARGRVDLLTVVAHEMGHLLGLE